MRVIIAVLSLAVFAHAATAQSKLTDAQVKAKFAAIESAKSRAAAAKSKAAEMKAAAAKAAEDAATAAAEAKAADEDVKVSIADAELAKAQLAYQRALDARANVGGTAPETAPEPKSTGPEQTTAPPSKEKADAATEFLSKLAHEKAEKSTKKVTALDKPASGTLKIICRFSDLISINGNVSSKVGNVRVYETPLLSDDGEYFYTVSVTDLQGNTQTRKVSVWAGKTTTEDFSK